MPTQRTAQRLARGFSLLEMLLVLLIMGLLMSAAAINVIARGQSARKESTFINMHTVETALDSYHLERGAYPNSEEGLAVLVPSHLKEMPKDGWKRVFFYVSPTLDGRDYEIISVGPDGELDTEDDIYNWQDDESQQGQ